MRDPSSHPRPAGLPGSRRVVALAVVAGLTLACTTEPNPGGATGPNSGARLSSTSPRETPDGSGSPSARPTASERLARVPEVPAARPAALADQLSRAGSTLRDPDAAAADVRRAGEFQQLAVRALAGASRGFRRTVTARLDAATASVTRACLRAAQVLGGLTTPQRTLPRWRIVAPPSPERLRGHYQLAQRRTGVPWSYLAAIHLVETRMGRIRGASTAGALGPMQFLPSTWDLYGAGGDINDPRDAILAAGRLLRANGAPGNMAEALFHYNPSDSYVRAVSEYARTMRRSASAYRGFWHWRVLYRHTRGTYVLPVGYPDARAVLLPED